ncbi:DEAD/DEAH box helicase [Kitasatospora sp. NPDC002227]|uniref:DEAD/DEAH box helicase n=1 Tax=Kitasatospora sp. NPDC002227 TaxID=3154773 RepID=UPI0033339CB6
MYALHALWRADGRLALWAEDAEAFAAPRRRDQAARLAGGPPQAHPFACPARGVAGLLAAIGPGLGWLAEQAPERWCTLLLPTLGGAPTPSPQLPVGAVSPGFGPYAWRVPVLLFPPTEAAQLLGELFDPHGSVATATVEGLGPVEVAYGASLRWLTAVHDLAWRLVGRGRVLPVLRSLNGAPYAHWQPALDPAARREAAALADGCPPVCRAEQRTSPAPTPTDLLADILDTLTDREARTALEGLPAPHADAPLGPWLAALHAPDGLLRPLPVSAPAVSGGRVGAGAAVAGAELGAAGDGVPASADAVSDVSRVSDVSHVSDVSDVSHVPHVPGGPLGGAGSAALGQSSAAVGRLGGFAELREQLAAWQAGAADPDSPVRLCFRLSEPLGSDDPDDPDEPHSDGGWRLDFLVQAVDQPSLLLPTADLWADGPAAAALARAVAGPPTAGPVAAAQAGAGSGGPPVGGASVADVDGSAWLDTSDSAPARASAPAPAPASASAPAPAPASASAPAPAPASASAAVRPGRGVAVDPVEALAAEFARAALRRPEYARALGAARPTGVDLDRAGALEFLREAAPALAEAGFGVLVPAWWQRRPRLGLALTAAPVAAPGAVERINQVDRDAVVAFSWQSALGEVDLTEQELADLGAAQQGLVRLRGRWVEVDPEQIAAALAFLRHQGTGVMSAPEALRLALAAAPQVAGFPVTAVHATGPLGDLLSGRAAGQQAAPPLPADFGATLRPYQERGLAWLHTLTRLGLGAVLADDMGLGKTVQTLALLAAEQRLGIGGPTLLVCPTSVVGNWRREAARFAPSLRVHVHHGADRSELPEETDLLITTYGLLQRDLPVLGGRRWRRVVCDEAQYIKNAATGQARAVRAIRADHRLALTGTPVENRLAELHAVLDFANPGLFGTAESFKERFAVPMEQGGSATAGAQLQRLTGPFLLRRLKSDPVVAAELPAKQEFTVRCHLTAEQAGLYQAVVADLLHRVQGIRGVERRGTVLAAIGKLKQVCNHPAQLLHDRSKLADRSGKVARLEEILAEALAEGDRALVFTQYAEFGRRLQPHLAERLGEEVLYLHGGTPRRRRDELVERFQQPDGPRVFLISLKAGGAGLNLTAANQVIHLDRWWNPAVEDQATDRAFRIGQRRNVQVRRLVCVGTVEERIGELIESKRALAEAAVGDGERWITELSTAALRELVSLSADDLEPELR